MSLFQPSISELTNLSQSPKTILITGGSSGIGLATATLLSQLNSAHNIVILDLQPPPSTFPHPKSHTLFIKCDITSWPSQRSAFATAHAHFQRLDHIFVNAGVAEIGDQFFTDVLDASGALAEPNRRCLTIDLDAAADTTKLAIYYLRKNASPQGGSIVLTTSLAGYLGSAGAPLYSAAKHGVVGLMRALKQECAKLHIAISVVAPAITVTPILTGNNRPLAIGHEEYAKQMAEVGVPINSAEDIALGVCWLLDQGKSGNGRGVFVQGGKYVDFEKGLAGSRETWMGREMLELFRGGRTAPLFSRLEADGGKAKAKI